MSKSILFSLLIAVASGFDKKWNQTAVGNCHFNINGDGCNMGFYQSWEDATNAGSNQINILKRNTIKLETLPCDKEGTCGEHGICSSETKTCVCNPYYIHEVINFTEWENLSNNTLIINPCHYEATSKKLIFFLSLFLGLCGFDWCWLGLQVNASFLCIGCFKLMTFGGLGIWWIFDVINLYTSNDSCVDGWGMDCYDDLTGTGAPMGVQLGL